MASLRSIAQIGLDLRIMHHIKKHYPITQLTGRHWTHDAFHDMIRDVLRFLLAKLSGPLHVLGRSIHGHELIQSLRKFVIWNYHSLVKK